MGTDDTRYTLEELRAAGDGFPGFQIRNTQYGLDLELPDGCLIDASNAALRHWNIYASRIAGTGYYNASDIKRETGRILGLTREPDNEHDPNAVAITIGKAGHKIGYVAKGKAKWISKAMDTGTRLVAHVTRNGDLVLATTPENWALMNSR